MGAYKNLAIEIEEDGFDYSHYLFDRFVEALKDKALFDPDLPMDVYPDIDLTSGEIVERTLSMAGHSDVESPDEPINQGGA